ncbi:MAG TPA: ABC transporter permease subunit [Candidatus Acidoferrales bacterium]|nr:ABC transporter permease subunit [Candidatus Acidoferrales bacterium]
MIGDILTIAWKDLREVLLQSGTLRRSLRGLLFSFLIFGVFLPLQIGPDLVRQPAAILPFAWVPLLLASGMVADGIAGERERHTLETLLASRLSDRSILLGKVVAAIAYGWGFMLVSAAVGLVTVNVVNAGHGLLMYEPGALAVLGVFGLLGAGLVACGGALVALRAPTVRQAAQNMNLAIFAVVLIPILGLQVLPVDVRRQVFTTLSGLDWLTIGVGAAAILAAADLLLLAATMARFQRARLILD